MADSPPASGPPIRWDVAEEHLDEAEFLFEQWLSALDSPLYTHEELAKGPEERLRAHIDGLAVGGDLVAEQLLWPAIAEGDEPARIAAATLALAELAGPRGLDAVISELGQQTDATRIEAISRGLVASERNDVAAKVVAAFERDPEAPGRAGWLQVMAARGSLPGPAIQGCLADPQPAVRAAAVGASRFASRGLALAAAEHLLGDADPHVSNAAIEVGLVVGSQAAWSLAVHRATSSLVAAELSRPAMLWVALLGEPALVDAIIGRLGDTDRCAAAIWALGFSGRAAAAEALLGLLADDEMGPLAGEAVAGITGLDPQNPRYWAERAVPTAESDDAPDGEVVPFEDDDLDADLTSSPEEELPTPLPEEIGRWWAEHRRVFDPRHRYLAGRLAHGTAYADALHLLSTRRRHPVAQEIAIRTRGVHHLPTRTLAYAQRPYLSAVAGMGQLDGQRPFARIS